jgi:hypothetical protein
MLEDINTGISWVLRHAARHGGDPDAVTLVGQSAGGQLALMALMTQVGSPHRRWAGAGKPREVLWTVLFKRAQWLQWGHGQEAVAG